MSCPRSHWGDAGPRTEGFGLSALGGGGLSTTTLVLPRVTEALSQTGRAHVRAKFGFL